MANPQKENGYTPIANELLEKLYAYKLNGTQFAIILVILRFSYGFRRKQCKMSVSFIAKATGKTERAIKKEVKTLIEKNLLIVVKESTKTEARIFQFNKNYDTWVGNNCSPGEQKDTSEGNSGSPNEGNKKTPKKESTKENIKEIYIDEFEKLIWPLYPNKKGKSKARDKYVKLRSKYSLEELKRTVERYSEECKSKDVQFIKYGSTFFNGGYEDYLDQNYKQEEFIDAIEQARREGVF